MPIPPRRYLDLILRLNGGCHRLRLLLSDGLQARYDRADLTLPRRLFLHVLPPLPLLLHRHPGLALEPLQHTPATLVHDV